MDYGYWISIYGAGALGALVRQLVDDNAIILPCKVTGGLALGFIGSMVVGGFVGMVVDGSLLTAAMAGFVGASVLERVIPNFSTKEINKSCDTVTSI